MEGELRVIAKNQNFESLLTTAFDQIRRNAKGNVTILLRIQEALQILADLTTGPRRREALFKQMQQVAELAARSVGSAHDRAIIEAHQKRAQTANQATDKAKDRTG